ncbi:MAG TPA: ABC transporter ATP-binding protein [Synergistales bacterium]|nr:ABC transporter ATP-binding protein [Synergistales bacterium]HRV71847.1 ABC transporter ATP-binding protein [Thermovirgaceae bacterium]
MICIRDLSVTYNTNARKVRAVREASIDIHHSAVTAIVGESGGGKSSLIYSILGLLPPEATATGKILFEGSDILSAPEATRRDFRGIKVALVTQGAMNSLTPVISVGEQIAETLRTRLGTRRREAAVKASELLEMVGLGPSFAVRFPHELSGGEKQRVVIALAISCSPVFLLADEPTSALDVITQAEIITLLGGMVRETGMGLLLVTHDLPLASSVSDSISVMHQGKIVESGPAEKIMTSPLHPHTRDLVFAANLATGRGFQ